MTAVPLPRAAIDAQARAAAKASAPAPTPTAQPVQLPLWPDVFRSIPNDLVRTALFNARNRRQPRQLFHKEPLAVVGDGSLAYSGTELRQDDLTVFLQLIHLARLQPAGQAIEVTHYAICKAIKWDTSGKGYARLQEVLDRLRVATLFIKSDRLDRRSSLNLLSELESEGERAGKPTYRFLIPAKLVQLFSDMQYTRIEWQQRLDLRDGLATWLHAYYASHATPYPVKIATLIAGAGLAVTRQDDQIKAVTAALDSLVGVGFLASYKIVGTLVHVARAVLTLDRPGNE